jgi:hypothetical protein
MEDFFKDCALLDRMVLKPLQHIEPEWELTWDEFGNEYVPEEHNLAQELNNLISELKLIRLPDSYHVHEDIIIEYFNESNGLQFEKQNGRWNYSDYASLLEQAGFFDINETHLINALAGRIQAAIDRGQTNFDDMESTHRKILGWVISIILYHRS